MAIITDRFFKIWEYPEVHIDYDIDLDEDYTINNAPDPRYKKLDYFIFRDEKVETEEIAKMYYHVIKVLFDENTAAFNHYFLKQTVGFSSDPSMVSPICANGPKRPIRTITGLPDTGSFPNARSPLARSLFSEVVSTVLWKGV